MDDISAIAWCDANLGTPNPLGLSWISNLSIQYPDCHFGNYVFFGPCQRTLESYRNPCEHRKLPRKSQIRKSWHRCGSQCLTHQRLRQSKPSKIAQFPKSIICCSWPWQFYSQCLSEISFQHRGIFLPHPSSIVDKSWCFGLLVLRCILPGENGAVGRRLRGATRFLHVEERLRMTWGCLAKSVRFMDFYLSLSQE